MSHHDKLLDAFEAYKAENEKFQGKGIKASAARARKALQEISGSCKERRKEITAEKESREGKVLLDFDVPVAPRKALKADVAPAEEI